LPAVFKVALETAIEDFGVEKNGHSVRQHVVAYVDDLGIIGRPEETIPLY
jgi:hypothetical protein